MSWIHLIPSMEEKSATSSAKSVSLINQQPPLCRRHFPPVVTAWVSVPSEFHIPTLSGTEEMDWSLRSSAKANIGITYLLGAADRNRSPPPHNCLPDCSYGNYGWPQAYGIMFSHVDLYWPDDPSLVAQRKNFHERCVYFSFDQACVK